MIGINESYRPALVDLHNVLMTHVTSHDFLITSASPPSCRPLRLPVAECPCPEPHVLRGDGPQLLLLMRLWRHGLLLLMQGLRVVWPVEGRELLVGRHGGGGGGQHHLWRG